MDRDGHKPNWSTDELEALGQGVSANTKSIKRKFSTGLGIGRLVNVPEVSHILCMDEALCIGLRGEGDWRPMVDDRKIFKKLITWSR
uniref:Myb-like domain-containing protein n=1 Tax=Magallana gigas TaxID=29159 RepID=K1PVW3_MAGGI